MPPAEAVCVWMTGTKQKHAWLYYVAGLVWVLLLVLLDQRAKAMAEAELKNAPARTLIPGILSLGYVENRGMAFGMLEGGRVFFVILTVVILIVLVLAYHAIPEKRRFWPLSLGVLFIIAGAVGNFIDRVRMGYVIDFFRLDFMEFPLFNLADCFLTWTAVVIALLLVFFYKSEDFKQIHL